jgi:hypothetical protein
MRSHGLKFRTMTHATETSACRSTFELQLMLDDRHSWTVSGPRGVALGRAKSLRCAMAAGLVLEDEGFEVVALVRHEPGRCKVIVLRGQMRALTHLVDQRLILH